MKTKYTYNLFTVPVLTAFERGREDGFYGEKARDIFNGPREKKPKKEYLEGFNQGQKEFLTWRTKVLDSHEIAA